MRKKKKIRVMKFYKNWLHWFTKKDKNDINIVGDFFKKFPVAKKLNKKGK